MTNSTQDTDRISREEMVEMFGSEMPIEAVNLLWGSDGSKTCGELRAELRRIAKARPTQDTARAAKAICAADGYDPDRLEPGDDPYHGEEGYPSPCIDGYNRKDEPCYFLWRRYDKQARAALEASERQSLSDRIDVLEGALKPFADCVDQIAADEDDEEWAKFRLLIKDYRRARAALHQEGIAP